MAFPQSPSPPPKHSVPDCSSRFVYKKGDTSNGEAFARSWRTWGVWSSSSPPPPAGLCRQFAQHPYTQNHDQQADRDDNEQRKREPTEHHGAGADARHDAAVGKVLGDGAGGHRGRVLPQDRDEHEDRGDEDDGQGDLGDGPAGERLHLALGTFAVLFLVPAREGGEEEEADEGEDDGDDAVWEVSILGKLGGKLGGKRNPHQVREHHHILKLARQPNQVQGVLVDRDLLSQGRRVVGT